VARLHQYYVEGFGCSRLAGTIAPEMSVVERFGRLLDEPLIPSTIQSAQRGRGKRGKSI